MQFHLICSSVNDDFKMKLHTSHDDVQGKKYDNDEFLSLSISILILTKHQNGHKKNPAIFINSFVIIFSRDDCQTEI